ncbi:hypothetical protein BH10ACI3_BH10ACI3_01570 [soil metagenome]
MDDLSEPLFKTNVVSYLKLAIVLFAFVAACSCSSIKPQLCTNQVRRWTFGDEPRYKGAVRSVLLSEQIYEFEGDFIYLHDKPIPKTLFDFDPAGKLLRKTDYLVDGKPTAPTEYVYDDNGLLIHENSISGIDGKPYLDTEYSYNEDGTNSEIRQVSLEEGVVYSIWKFQNDTENNYSEFVATKTNGKFEMKLGIKRDERCRIDEIYAFPYVGLSLGRSKISYDQNDNVIASNAYYPLGISAEKRKYEYEFDTVGNWTKRTDYSWKKDNAGNSDWKLMNEQFRKIEYYNQ